MIHNPDVNRDLEEMGVRFIMDTSGKQFIPWEEVTADDIVIIPAFGTTLEIEALLKEKGISVEKYNTTCPFVERVWNRAEKLGQEDYTIIIHGKARHEETRATFSHAKSGAPSVIIADLDEAKILSRFITGELPAEQFDDYFLNRYSAHFNPAKDLAKIGVINQTTMLASETQEIAEFLKNIITSHYPQDDPKNHFADTRDTLCYATNDNQQSTLALMEHEADLAIVIGGYNSSNTSHLVELLEKRFPTYFIKGTDEILSGNRIEYFNLHLKDSVIADAYLPAKDPVTIAITSGASCPDALVDKVIDKLLSQFPQSRSKAEILSALA